MTTLREEIEAELKHVRLDKTALYNILLKIIDQGVGGGSGGPGLPGPAGPPGPLVLPVLPVPRVPRVTPQSLLRSMPLPPRKRNPRRRQLPRRRLSRVPK